MNKVFVLLLTVANSMVAYGQYSSVPYPILAPRPIQQAQQQNSQGHYSQNIYERIPYVMYSGPSDDGKNRYVFVPPHDGCSNTPITLSTTRNYFETWDNSFSGGSNSYDHSASGGSYSYSDQGSSATAIANRRGAYANAQQNSSAGRGSSYDSETHKYNDWYKNRLRGQRQKNDSDTITVFPCLEVQQ